MALGPRSTCRPHMRRRAVTLGGLCLLACTGCGFHKQVAVSGRPKPLPAISPLVADGKLWVFGMAFRTANPSDLLVNVDEGTRDRSDSCWRSYRATAGSRKPYPVISLIPTSRPSHVVCAEPGVGPFYVLVHLPKPYDGPDVIDAATGRVVPIQSRVPFTTGELVSP